MKRIHSLLMVLASLLFAMGLNSQTDEELWAQLLEEERNSVEALALYPEATRLDILEAAKHPEALVKLESLQSKSSDAFKLLLDNYPKEIQEAVWDLTRYPGLVLRLVENRGATQTVLADYPPEIHKRATEVASIHLPLLSEVERLNRQWQTAFGNLLNDYPPVTQDALRRLVELPEVLSILTEDIRLTVMVGDLYQKNPQWLLQQMDSLNLAVARERAKEVDDWKNSLETNPEAKDELMQSAESFAGTYAYDDAYYDYDKDYYERDADEVVVVHHYYYHYPYWFGYPYWYAYPRWRPYPYWYDWGFYWGPGHVIIVIDLPSFYFTHWFFNDPWHHYHYSHLSGHFTNHYYGHRRSSGSVTVGLDEWRKRNRDVVTDEWLDNARKRPESFREFGKFEAERQKYNRNHADKPVSQSLFLEKNRKQYPVLRKEVEKRQEQEQIRREQPPVVKPRVDQPPVEKPKIKEPQPPKPAVKEPERKREAATDFPKVDKATEHHQNTWNKSKKETVQPRQVPERQPQKQPKTKEAKPAPKVKKGREGQ